MNHIKSTISNNPLAPYVIRSVDVGSEPLLDQVCWHRWLLSHAPLLTLSLIACRPQHPPQSRQVRLGVDLRRGTILIAISRQMKGIASPKGIQVGISEMRYSYSQISSSLAKQFFDTCDYVHARKHRHRRVLVNSV